MDYFSYRKHLNDLDSFARRLAWSKTKGPDEMMACLLDVLENMAVYTQDVGIKDRAYKILAIAKEMESEQ